MSIKELAEKADTSCDIEGNFVLDAESLKRLVELVLDECYEICDDIGGSNKWSEASQAAEAIKYLKESL